MNEQNLLTLAEAKHATEFRVDGVPISLRDRVAPFSDICNFLGVTPVVNLDEDHCCAYVAAEAGTCVHHCGDRLEHIYVIASGIAKTMVPKENEHFIAGFFVPGEMLGIDGLDGLIYPNAIFALTDLLLLKVPYLVLLKHCKHYPEFDNALMRVFADRISGTTAFMEVMARAKADVKVAYFLSDLATRLGTACEPADHLDFAIPRRDIASYLGVAYETLSRILHDFCDLGIIAMSRSELTITDHALLQDICGGYAERLKIYQGK